MDARKALNQGGCVYMKIILLPLFNTQSRDRCETLGTESGIQHESKVYGAGVKLCALQLCGMHLNYKATGVPHCCRPFNY